MAEQGGLGGHIQYEVGMMLDDKQKELWNSYTAENREKYFWLFLNSFVGKWEQKVIKELIKFCKFHTKDKNKLYYKTSKLYPKLGK